MTAISAGRNHTVYLKVDGSALAVGSNLSYELGDGSILRSSKPVQGRDAAGNPLTEVEAFSTDGGHAVFLKGNGTVMAMGANESGHLGDGSTTRTSNTVQVLQGGHPITDITAISAGGYHSVLLKSDGTVWATGKNLSLIHI